MHTESSQRKRELMKTYELTLNERELKLVYDAIVCYAKHLMVNNEEGADDDTIKSISEMISNPLTG